MTYPHWNIRIVIRSCLVILLPELLLLLLQPRRPNS